MKLFRLDASIRAEGSTSRAIGDIVQATLAESTDSLTVIRRDVGLDPLDPRVWIDAALSRGRDASTFTPAQKAALATAATLTDELLEADAYLFAVPLYNFGAPQHLKAWVDLVIADPRMATGAGQPLAGRPAVLVMARGGAYGEGTPRDGWDHAIGWIRRILVDVWGMQLQVVEAEFTLVGVNPALDQFKELADQMRAEAEARAASLGRELAGSAT